MMFRPRGMKESSGVDTVSNIVHRGAERRPGQQERRDGCREWQQTAALHDASRPLARGIHAPAFGVRLSSGAFGRSVGGIGERPRPGGSGDWVARPDDAGPDGVGKFFAFGSTKIPPLTGLWCRPMQWSGCQRRHPGRVRSSNPICGPVRPPSIPPRAIFPPRLPGRDRCHPVPSPSPPAGAPSVQHLCSQRSP